MLAPSKTPASRPQSSRPQLLLAADPLGPGDVVDDKYEIIDRIAEGGMGVIYRARQRDLDIQVALKVVQPELLGDETSIQRFLREAHMAAGLRSPHAAKVFDFGRLPDGSPYLVMELLEGVDLAHLLREQGPLPISFAARAVMEASLALSDAHACGIVHRDLKPDNLFLARQHDGTTLIKIVDFGIAKLMRDESARAVTLHGAVGSPNYMAPEQMLNPECIDMRSDIWALGAVLFELLTARSAFEGSTIAEVCANVLTKQAPSPSSIRGDIPPALDAIVARCMAREPEERFASARELVDALRPFVELQVAPPEFAPEPAIERAFFDSEPPPELAFEAFDEEVEPAAVPMRPRWPWMLGVAAVLVAIAAIAFAILPRTRWQPMLAGWLNPPKLNSDSDEPAAVSSWSLASMPALRLEQPEPPPAAPPRTEEPASVTLVAPPPAASVRAPARRRAPAAIAPRVAKPEREPAPSQATPLPTPSVPSFDTDQPQPSPAEPPAPQEPEKSPFEYR